MTIENSAGQPQAPGIYAVEVYHGWKLLEWHEGAWWHMDRVGRWETCQPLQWVGPLPQRMKDRELIEYDL